MGSEPLLYRKVTNKGIEFSLYKSHRVFGVSFDKQNREYAEAATSYYSIFQKSRLPVNLSVTMGTECNMR